MDQYYFETGYIADNYFGYVADASATLSGAFSPSFTVIIADATGYFITDYIDQDYIVGGVTQEASASLSASATVTAAVGVIRTAEVTIASAMTFSTVANVLKNHTAILDTTALMNAIGVKTTDVDVTLENIVNLSLQSAKIAGFTADLSTVAQLSTDVTTAELADAQLSAAFGILTSAQIANQRPRPWTVTNTPAIDTLNTKYGAGSLLQGNNNSVNYYASTDYRAFKTIDLWYKPKQDSTTSGLSNNFIYQTNAGTTEYFYATVQRIADLEGEQRFRIVLRTRIGGTNYNYSSAIITPWTNFKHIRIERDDKLYVWIDGVLDTPIIDTSTGSYPTLDTQLRIGANPGGSDPNLGYVDELRISSLLLTDTATASFTPPSLQYQLTDVEQSTTILMSHYNEDFSDDVGAYVQGLIDLSASANLSIDAVATVSATIALAASATVAATPSETTQADAALQALFTQQAVAVKTVDAVVNISGAASFSVETIAINPGDAYLETAATLSVDAVKQIGGEFDLSSSVTIEVIANKTQQLSAAPSSAAAISTSVQKVTVTSASLDLAADLTATGATNKTTGANLALTATAQIIGTRQPPRMRLAAWLNTGGVYGGVKTVYDSYNNFYGLGKNVGVAGDFLIVKANAIGDIQWQKSYTNFIDYPDFAELHYYNEHLYVVAGTRVGTTSETDDSVYIVKINVTDGTVVQSRRLAQASMRNARVRNGQLYISGFSSSQSYETRVVRIDLNDLTTNSLSIDIDDGSGYDYFETYIDANTSGQMYLATNAQVAASGENFAILQKLDSNGTMLASVQVAYAGYAVIPQDLELDSQGRVLVYLSSNSPGNQGIAQFDADLNLIWMRNFETDVDGTDYLKIALDSEDQVLVLNGETNRVVVFDSDGTYVVSYSVESGEYDVRVKDEWYLTAGDGYWEGINTPYDRVRNIWLSQTLIEDTENPIYAPEPYAGADGRWTYEAIDTSVSTSSVTTSAFSTSVNSQFLINTAVSIASATTEYEWTILARLIPGFANDVNSVATLYQDSTTGRIRFVDSALTVAATLYNDSTNGRIRFVDSDLNSIASVDALGGLIRPGAADLNSVFAAEIAAQRIRDNEFELDVSANVNVLPGRIRNPGTATGAVTSDVQSAPVKIVSAEIVIDGVLQFNSTVNAKRTAETQMAVAATLQGTPNKNAVTAVLLDAAATMDATAFNTVSFESSISANSTLTVDGQRIRFADSAVSSAASIEIYISQIKGYAAQFETVKATVACEPGRIRPQESGLNSVATLTVDGARIRFADSEMSAQFDPFYANAFRVVQAEVTLSAFVVTVTAGDIIAIDPFRTLLITEETRWMKILEEERLLAVKQETRVLEI